MWKSYNRFYTQIIKSEAGSIYQCRNVNQIPSVKRVSISCVSNNPNSVKSTLMTLSALQLVFDKKAKIVTSRDSVVLTKVRKGQPLGAKVFLTKGSAWQFLNFLTFNLMPQLDLTKKIYFSKRNSDFKFIIKSSAVFNVLKPFFNFFQFLPSIQVVFGFKNPPINDKPFFWRLLKLPVASSKEDF